MPVSVRQTPFNQPLTAAPVKLRTPQARCLAALQPDDPSDPLIDWPLVTRAQLSIRMGYTFTSGTVTRAINGTRGGNGTTPPQVGLLEQKLVEEVVLDIEGISEVNYRATADGVRAYQAHVAKHGELPKVKDPSTYLNDRYKKNSEEKS